MLKSEARWAEFATDSADVRVQLMEFALNSAYTLFLYAMPNLFMLF